MSFHYKTYVVIGEPKVNFDTEIDFYMSKSGTPEDAVPTAFPSRHVSKSSEDAYFNIPNMGYYELTESEAQALKTTSSIKDVARHFLPNETIVKYQVSKELSFSQSMDIYFKSGGAFPDFYSLTRMEDFFESDFTGSITGSRLPLNATFYSASQEAFWYNGGEEIFANSSSYSQSFLDAYVEASMSWDQTSGSTSNIDGLNAIGLELDGLITPWYLEKEPAYDDVNGVQTPFGGGGLGFYNMCPTVNVRWRGGGNDNQTSYYSGDWPGSQVDRDGQMVNWGLYAHSTPKEEFDWRIMYQLDTDSASIDAYGNFPLKSTSVPYNFTATGKNVDLIIMDTGVNTQHPEFKYYDPNFLSGSGGWVSRVIKTDWPDYCPGLLTHPIYDYTSTNFRSLYYDNWHWEHGTSVASNAAGRTQGWAKEARIHSLNIFGGMLVNHAFECVLNFHVSKSINPSTGIKDPTVVNMSWGYVVTPIDHSQWYDENGKLTSWSDPTEIDSFYYKGVNLYPGYSGSENEDGDLVYNLTPGHEQGIRFKTSESFTTTFGDGFERKIMEVRTSAYVGGVEELMQQCIDAGVIFVGSAGNDGSLRVRSGSRYEGVDYDHRGLWDSYFTKNGSSTQYYTNRASTPVRNNAVINVGGLAPHIVIDRGTDLLTGSLLTSGSKAYDIYGEAAGCPWVFGGAGSMNFIKSDRRNIPEFEHSDMHEIMGTSNRSAKRGAGVGDTFPGWESANSSSYISPVWFSATGDAIDIWAAGYKVPVARADFDDIIANATGFGWKPTKPVSTSLAHYQNPYQPSYYFLGDQEEYPSYYNLYPDTSPPLRITHQKYRTQAGTSFSSPNVAGVVCLFLELNPGATWSQIKKFLIEQGQKAIPVWVDNPSQNYADFTGSMKSDFALASGNYGFGKTSPVVNDDSMAPSMNRDIAMCGAPPVMLYWPYTKRETKLNNVNFITS